MREHSYEHFHTHQIIHRELVAKVESIQQAIASYPVHLLSSKMSFLLSS